jgi:uncharacterized protein (DUF2336 family)
MADKLEHLEGLARLTRENDDEGRQNLLREVTNMFMDTSENLSDRELSYFGDIMGGMVGQVETMVRQHLSETISSVSNAPHDVILALANDELEVALPVLQNSDVLKDEDLVKIANNQSQEHLNAIAGRETVGKSVTDVLVNKGDETVLGTLAVNNGAEFSRGGMETFFDRAKDNEELNLSLVKRSDVPADLAQNLFWRVSDAMRDKILNATEDLSAEQVDQLMEEAEKWFVAQSGKATLTPAEKYIVRKDKLSQLDANLLLSLVREDKVPEFIAGLARMANISLDIVRQAFFDPESEKLTLICKAVDIDFDVFGEIVYCINLNAETEDKDLDALLGVYQRIEAKTAQRTMRFLRTRLKLTPDANEGIFE